jgi:anti-sigma factor RsiW
VVSLAERDGIHSDLGAYLLGALGDDDLHRFAAHLTSCEECRATSAQLEGTAEMLARATVPEALPPELQARTLGAIRAAAANGAGRSPSAPRRGGDACGGRERRLPAG